MLFMVNRTREDSRGRLPPPAEARHGPCMAGGANSAIFTAPGSAYHGGKPAFLEDAVPEAMSDIEKRNGGDAPTTGVVVRAKPKTKKPSMYKVLMLNDDYTPMEFVVHILERFFNKNREEATRIMLHVHRRGVGVCGVYTYEVAENKVTQVMDFARQHQHPLQCTLEKD
jgi:ATP-dependent Clp protease adaptor protein ClpS